MRIIAGEHRGRRLLPPETGATRPITDRVKQSLFDILSPRIEGAAVIDLFCGTGSMGLECLSRGARAATFVDAEPSAIRLLRTNIAALNVAERSEVIQADVFKWAGRGESGAAAGDLIFLDPPYRFLRERADELKTLATHLAQQAGENGLIVFRHDAADELLLPGLAPVDRREYGGMILEFLARAPAAK